ncbi:MAG: cobaltochelatase subunit CobN [Ferrimicrobium sp.]|uniref:Cobaltochelatase subunit CobN n=1 Tax=Ferrimicrobium acidiphilum TaxID=121039 RepID=A0ABV3Y6X8_9ACTN|nr:cobaltochelatase subunit CobN [Ferrimicrobium sp.]MCL5974112.1 cobaltochelatase subunit CobN [Actinomycetota bacterium]
MKKFVYLTNADTEVLALRSAWEELPGDFGLTVRQVDTLAGVDDLLDEARIVVIRLLGGARASRWFPLLAAGCQARGIPFVSYPGDNALDAEMMASATVTAGVWEEGFRYLIEGGVRNLSNFACFLSDTVTRTGYGFAPVEPLDAFGRLMTRTHPESRGRIAVVIYRAHVISGNLSFVRELVDIALHNHLSIDVYYTYSLRVGDDESSVIDLIAEHQPDVVVATVLAGGHAEALAWEAGQLARLEVPVIQALIATTPRAVWYESQAGLRPIDVAMNVAMPEFDGRIITVPIAFKELTDDDEEFGAAISAYRLDAERCQRLMGYIDRLVRLRVKANSDKRIALVLSAYPTKRSRLGNAVGLDTPASLMVLAERMRQEGYVIEGLPSDANELMALLGDLIDYEHPAVRAGGGVHLDGETYRAWFGTLPEELRQAVIQSWGPPPGDIYLQDGRLVFPALQFGNLTVAVQPPRGYGENPIAIYHSPELPPTHHYLAFYYWLASVVDVDALCHLGKHGTAEWLPGKSVGMGPTCYPDIVLGELPVVYPFVINDPGEGTQAKRRTHAVLIGHLVPPMTRAESYGDLARLEMLMDEHQRISALDPTKLPAIRAQIWELIETARLHEDMGVSETPNVEQDLFDEFLLHVDGYLCELKDSLIRGGLHILGDAPKGRALIDMLAAITRVPQLDAPALRPLLAKGSQPSSSRIAVDEDDERVTEVLWAYAEHDFDVSSFDDPALCRSLGLEHPLDDQLRAVLTWIGAVLVPNLLATTGEVDALLGALAGRAVPSGPSGAPTRGMAHALPTGRNFYSVDPRSLPTQISFLTGQRLAEALVEQFRGEHEGKYPRSIGVVLWGTAAMRTGGDDVSTVLALLGVRPRWDPISHRITSLEVVTLEELARPRVDVTCRISGFFRDAFPGAIDLLDEAFELIAKETSEGTAMNPVAAAGTVERIFGPSPRSYGSGILPLLESRSWHDDQDLSEVYLTWSGFSYSRSGYGVPNRSGLEARLRVVEVAYKAQDNREHDIFDSDDYLQDHGGMVAAARALGARDVRGYFGDSANPGDPKVRSIEEEAARVVRSRVLNPKWLDAMMVHGYKGAFEMAATVDYLFGYDATAHVAKDWMYDAVHDSYVNDAKRQEFLTAVNPTALVSICERLLEAHERGMWQASPTRVADLRRTIVGIEGDMEDEQR